MSSRQTKDNQRKRIAIVNLELDGVFKRTLGCRSPLVGEGRRLTPMEMDRMRKVSVIVRLAPRPSV